MVVRPCSSHPVCFAPEHFRIIVVVTCTEWLQQCSTKHRNRPTLMPCQASEQRVIHWKLSAIYNYLFRLCGGWLDLTTNFNSGLSRKSVYPAFGVWFERSMSRIWWRENLQLAHVCVWCMYECNVCCFVFLRHTWMGLDWLNSSVICVLIVNTHEDRWDGWMAEVQTHHLHSSGCSARFASASLIFYCCLSVSLARS